METKKRYVSCYICGARKEAIKRWNERVPCQELVTEPGEDYDFTRFYGYDDTEVDVTNVDGLVERIKSCL